MAVCLSEILPAPTNVSDDWSEKDQWFKQHEKSLAVAIREPPPYGSRSGWTPRSLEDFGDGGAFPEIHVAQHPLNMGKDDVGGNKSAGTLAVQVDSEGKVRYDALLRHGQSKDKIIYSKFSDLQGSVIDEEDESFRRPDEEEIKGVTERTREALERLTSSKISAAMPVKRAEQTAPAQYIRYTPAQQSLAFNSGAQQRVIRMVEVQKDPMEPPRFKINQKLPRGPPSPPAPVLHSPTRKVTVKEQAEWKIPPCISNWKNAKGYTIPLDKRLAADGRGLQQVHINENFSKLAEALYIADRKAREAVELRSQMEKKLAQKQKEEKEEKMRELARKAREERAGIKTVPKLEPADEVRERDELRHERQQERRRDKNISRAAPEVRAKLRKDKDRDMSEKIALGLPDARVNSQETQFDQRLFNTTKGLDSGGGLDDETYAVYDKPWRSGEAVAKNIYRPSKNLDSDIYGEDLDKIISTNRFVPDKGFAGADHSAARREGPVQFERQEEEDPFGLGKFLDEAKKGHKRGGGGGDDNRERDSKRRK